MTVTQNSKGMHTHYLEYLGGNGALLFPTLHWRRESTKHPLLQKSARPKYFEDEHYLFTDDVEQITTMQALYLPVGEVLMVRSANVPMMGDHFAVISGPIENKEHGVRPQTISIATSPNGIQMLDLFEPLNGATLLRLKPAARDAFHAYHQAKVERGAIHCLISKQAVA